MMDVRSRAKETIAGPNFLPSPGSSTLPLNQTPTFHPIYSVDIEKKPEKTLKKIVQHNRTNKQPASLTIITLVRNSATIMHKKTTSTGSSKKAEIPRLWRNEAAKEQPILPMYSLVPDEHSNPG